MKVKKITSEIKDLVEDLEPNAIVEYSTDDRTRIDIAILDQRNKILAIEFEKTYKWIRRRILYNGIKAYRAGFDDILFIYPFSKRSVPNSWVIDFLEDLGMEIELLHPDNCFKYIEEKLNPFT